MAESKEKIIEQILALECENTNQNKEIQEALHKLRMELKKITKEVIENV